MVCAHLILLEAHVAQRVRLLDSGRKWAYLPRNELLLAQNDGLIALLLLYNSKGLTIGRTADQLAVMAGHLLRRC